MNLANNKKSISETSGLESNTVQCTSTTYVSGTGTAGVDNTAQTILTRVFNANIMSQLGDRIRVRAYYQATGGSAIIGTIKINGVTVTSLSASATNLQVVEAWLHYIDNTHANIIENVNGGLGSTSAINVAGFSWDTIQNVIFTQNQVTNQHLVIYFLAVDFFPKGII